MSAPENTPLISVAVPTYRRRDLLERAVESVRGQTYAHWELVVSDDEAGEGETWRYLARVAAEDPRVRPVKNAGTRGQIGNTNHALRQARGAWIKLLHDDDALKPTCLEELVGVVQDHPEVACVICGVEKWVDGVLRSTDARSGWPLLEVLRRDQIHLAMFVNENVGGALPSQKMIRREVVDRNTLMEPREGIRLMVDSVFNARLFRHGDLMIYRKPLVEWHQGSHETQTTEVSDAAHDAEAILFRRYVRAFVPEGVRSPSVAAAEGMIRLQRALWRLKRRRLREFARMVAGVWHPAAYVMLVHWLAHQSTRGRVAFAKREILIP